MKNSRAAHPRQGVYRSPRLKVDARDVQMRSTPSVVHPVFVPRSVIPAHSLSVPQEVPIAANVEFATLEKPDVAVSAPSVKHEAFENTVIQTDTQIPHAVRPRHRRVKRIRQKKHTGEEPSESTDKKRLDVRVLYAAAACVIVIGGFLSWRAYSLNIAVENQVKNLQANSDMGTTEQSTSLPSDTKPADKNYIQHYKVSPTLPQTLTIKKIGVSARILQVGIDKEGRMDVPKTAYDVAWYNGSSRPSEAGAMVIDGHVQGVGGGAIFTNLKKLVAGDEINVTRGDGKVFSYGVTKVETIPLSEVDMNKLLVSVDTNKPGLNLITCGGNYDTESETFNSRTIVYTLQQ